MRLLEGAQVLALLAEMTYPKGSSVLTLHYGMERKESASHHPWPKVPASIGVTISCKANTLINRILSSFPSFITGFSMMLLIPTLGVVLDAGSGLLSDRAPASIGAGVVLELMSPRSSRSIRRKRIMIPLLIGAFHFKATSSR